MSSRSLNEILIKSPTELFDLVFAAYNLSFISPRVVCLRLYAKGRCTRFQQRALFTVLYSRFKHCTKNVSTFTAQPTILEYRNKRHIRVLYDGFKLSSGCIKATKPEGLSALIQPIDSLKPS